MPKTDTTTIGALADEQARTQDLPVGVFSYKADGLVLPRDTAATVLDSATVTELVDVTDWPYPKNPTTT